MACLLQNGMTPLAIACKEGYVDIVSDLLDQGAYLNMSDKVSKTHKRGLDIPTKIKYFAMRMIHYFQIK